MSFPGSMPCGSLTQLMRLSGVLAKWPAIVPRLPKWSRGGATSPFACLMPGIWWQAPQPYRMICCLPASGLAPRTTRDPSAPVSPAPEHAAPVIAAPTTTVANTSLALMARSFMTT